MAKRTQAEWKSDAEQFYNRQKQDRLHKRLTADLPIKAKISISIIQDELGENIPVVRSIRDDPLAGMHARKQIDDAQLAAGRTWQRHYENSEIGSIRAIDPGKEAVDGGRAPDPITDHQMKAFKALDGARQEVGTAGALLLFDVLAHRKSIKEAALLRDMRTDLEIKYVGRRFRECLETLAKLWGLAG